MLEPVQFCVGTSSLVVPGPAGYRSQGEVQVNNARPNILQMQPLPYNIRKGELQTANFRSRSSRVKCSAVLDARCAAASATQTLVRRSRTTTISPGNYFSPISFISTAATNLYFVLCLYHIMCACSFVYMRNTKCSHVVLKILPSLKSHIY